MQLISNLRAPKPEARVLLLGSLSTVYGVLFGLLYSVMTVIYVRHGAQGNLYDVATGLAAVLALTSCLSIPIGIGLVRQQKWSVRGSFGICIGLLVTSGLGFVLNVVLDSPTTVLPIAPFTWAIVLNFVLRPSQLAKSLRVK